MSPRTCAPAPGPRRSAHRRTLLVAGATALAALAFPAFAAGDAVTAVPIASDLVSEVPTPIAISGVADRPSTLTVGWSAIGAGVRQPYRRRRHPE
jgi:hypothetical protein